MYNFKHSMFVWRVVKEVSAEAQFFPLIDSPQVFFGIFVFMSKAFTKMNGKPLLLNLFMINLLNGLFTHLALLVH